MKRILTIDGGGIKGIIPATFILSLENYTKKLARETFSFVAGTSTGALIASSVAAGIPGEQLVDLYLNKSKEIFTGSFDLERRLLLGFMYDPENIRKVISSVLGSNNGWAINDCPIDILITAKRVVDGKQWYFVKDHIKNNQTTGSCKLVDCAVASASAPTYFHSSVIPGLGDMIDGGVGVYNNPIYQACVEAFCYADYNPLETSILSIGTGKFYDSKTPKGLLGWMEWSINAFMSSPEDQQTEIVQRCWPNTSVTRFNPTLTSNIPMDDPKQVPALYQFAQQEAAKIDWSKIII